MGILGVFGFPCGGGLELCSPRRTPGPSGRELLRRESLARSKNLPEDRKKRWKPLALPYL